MIAWWSRPTRVGDGLIIPSPEIGLACHGGVANQDAKAIAQGAGVGPVGDRHEGDFRGRAVNAQGDRKLKCAQFRGELFEHLELYASERAH